MNSDGEAVVDGGIRIEIHGVPRAQPRGRHVGGRVVSTTGPAVLWRKLVTQAAQAASAAVASDGGQFPLRGPVEFTMEARFPTTDQAKWGQWRTALRDRDFDNVQKLVDAVVKAGVLVDDGQIARSVYEAVWVPPTQAGAVMVLRALEPRQAAGIDQEEAPGWLGAG